MAIELPVVGSRVEGSTLDIKGDYSQPDPLAQKLEMAKDVAAFANSIGGRIIVGAYEASDGTLAKYVPLDVARVRLIADAFDLAVKERLSPPPVFDVQTVSALGDSAPGIVVVTVQAYPGQPVGVRVPIPKALHGNGEDAFRFPVRVGTRTVYFEPHQLGLIMDAHYRRIAQLLGQIPIADDVYMQGSNGAGTVVTLVRVDVLGNVFAVKTRGNGRARVPASTRAFPIDSIQTVYRASPERWHVIIREIVTAQH